MSRFSLLGLGGNGTPAATLPMVDFHAPDNVATLGSGIASGMGSVGAGLIEKGNTQARAEAYAEAERERAAREQADLQEKLHRSELNLWGTQLDTTLIATQREVAAEAAKQTTLGGAMGVVDQRYNALREMINQQEDQQARAEGMLALERSYSSTLSHVSNVAAQRVVEQTGASIDANIRETVSGIGDGSIPLAQGIAGMNAMIDAHAESLGPEQADALRQRAGKEAIEAALAGMSPEQQLSLLSTPAAKRYYDPKQIATAKEQAKKDIEQQGVIAATKLKTEMDNGLGQVLAGPMPPTADDVKRTASLYADAIVAADPKHPKDEIIENALIPRLKAAAELAKLRGKDYAQAVFDSIVPALPGSGTAQNEIATQQNELNENASAYTKQFDSTRAFVSGFSAGVPVTNRPSETTLNTAFEQIGDPPAFAKYLLQNNIPFPSALNAHLQNALGAGIGNAPQVVRMDEAMPIIEAMNAANPVMARRTLAGMGTPGNLGLIALRQTRGLAPNSLGYAAVMETLSNPQARNSIAWLESKDSPKKDPTSDFYENMVESLGKYSPEMQREYDAAVAYNFAFAQQHPQFAGSETTTQVAWAKKRAIDSMKETTISVEVPTGTHWYNADSKRVVPADVLGVGSNAQPDAKGLTALQNAMNASYVAMSDWHPGRTLSIMPELAVRDGLTAVIPVVLDGENHLAGAILWIPGSQISSVLGPDDPKAQTVRAMIETGLPPEAVAPDAGIRHPGNGVTKSVAQFDQTFYRDDQEHGLGQQLSELTARQWQAAHDGLLPDWSDSEQKDQFTMLLRANAERLGWSFSEPATSKPKAAK